MTRVRDNEVREIKDEGKIIFTTVYSTLGLGLGITRLGK